MVLAAVVSVRAAPQYYVPYNAHEELHNHITSLTYDLHDHLASVAYAAGAHAVMASALAMRPGYAAVASYPGGTVVAPIRVPGGQGVYIATSSDGPGYKQKGYAAAGTSYRPGGGVSAGAVAVSSSRG